MRVDLRRVAIAAAAAAIAVGVAACGDDDESDGGAETTQPKTVAMELSGSGKNLRFEVPKSVSGGVVRIEFTNSAKGEHSAQLGYVDEGHTAREGLEAAGAWADGGRPLPDWVHTAGGVPFTPTGATSAVIQELTPGKYFVLDPESDESAAFFEVTRSASAAQLPTPAARIDEVEYSFDSSGLKAGKGQVLIDNQGAEPHFIDAAPLKPGKTIADARRFLREEKGESPLVDEAGVSTPVIDGGLRQVVELDLRKGSYVLLCFVPDRKGGPPHALKGMVSEAVVR